MNDARWNSIIDEKRTAVAHSLFVEVDSVMVSATGITATTGMLTVLANSAVAVTHMTAKLPGLFRLVRVGVSGRTSGCLFVELQLNERIRQRTCIRTLGH